MLFIYIIRLLIVWIELEKADEFPAVRAIVNPRPVRIKAGDAIGPHPRLISKQWAESDKGPNCRSLLIENSFQSFPLLPCLSVPTTSSSASG